MSIDLIYRDKIKRIEWGKVLNQCDFIDVIENIFHLDSDLICLKDSDGTLYEPSFFVKNVKRFLGESFTLIIKDEKENLNIKHFERIIKLNSINEFKELISQSNILNIIFVFKKNDSCEYYLNEITKLINKIDESIALFYIIIDDSKEIYLNYYLFHLNPPFFAFFDGEKKFMEMNFLQNSVNNFKNLIDRLALDNSEFNLDKLKSNNSISCRTHYILSERIDNHHIVLDNLYEEKILSNKNYFYLKYLLFDHNYELETILNNYQTKIINKSELVEKFNENNWLNYEQSVYFLESNRSLSVFDIENKNSPKIIKNKKKDSISKSYFLNKNSKMKNQKYSNFENFMNENNQYFEPEIFGMLILLFKEKNKELLDILNDFQTQELLNINKMILKFLGHNFFVKWLIDNFTKCQIEFIESNKSIINSKIYNIFQSFKYDQNIYDLHRLLLNIFNEKKIIEGDSVIENDKLLESNEKKFGNLLEIAEKSSREEQSPIFEKLPRKSINKYAEVLNYTTSESKKKVITLENNNIDIINNNNNDKDSNFCKEIIDNFYSKIDYDVKDKSKFSYLIKEKDPALLKLLNICKENKEIDINQSLTNLITSSPRAVKKVHAYNLFRFSLDELYNKSLISLLQLKLLVFLFVRVEFSILACFEVFQITNNESDYLETLNLIYKIYYVKLENELDDIEDYNNDIELQLKIIYAFQSDLELNERKILEKIIKNNDKEVIYFHGEYRKNRDKQKFINNLKELCKTKANVLNNNVEIDQESLLEKTINSRKTLIELCVTHKFLTGLSNIEIVNEMIENNDYKIESIFNIYDLTRDKQDLTENIKLLYTFQFKYLFKRFVKQNFEPGLKLDKLFKAINENSKILNAAFSIYYSTNDEDDRIELIDTLNKFIKLSN